MSNDSLDYAVKVSRKLLGYLSPDKDKKHSKITAFCDLLECAANGNQTSFAEKTTAFPMQEGQIAVTVSGLARHWNWHRTTVRNFLSTLESFGIFRMEQKRKYFILSLHLERVDENNKPEYILTEEERRLNQWLCGYVSMEEIVESVVRFITESDVSFSDKPTDKYKKVGERLHYLIAHIILQHTNLIPADKVVSESLRRLFMEQCNSDLASLLLLLTVSGIRLMSEEQPQRFIIPCDIPLEARKDLDIVIRYYLPFISSGTANNTY